MARARHDGAEADRGRWSARDKLLAAAAELFYRRGIRAVGVDEVVRRAGVAKVSLYRAFPSKDDLIVAYLEGQDAAFWRDWDAAVEGAPDPSSALRAAVDLLCAAIARPDYRGCPFANFACEFPDPEHAGRRAVQGSKRELRTRLSALAGGLGRPDREALADALVLLVEGAFASSQTAEDGRRVASRSLRRSVEMLVGRS